MGKKVYVSYYDKRLKQSMNQSQPKKPNHNKVQKETEKECKVNKKAYC